MLVTQTIHYLVEHHPDEPVPSVPAGALGPIPSVDGGPQLVAEVQPLADLVQQVFDEAVVPGIANDGSVGKLAQERLILKKKKKYVFMVV